MDVLLKASHEGRWLEQGWHLALQFNEGWTCVRVTGREYTGLRPYSLGALAAVTGLATFNQIQDAATIRILEPQTEFFIYHHFWGVTPSAARIYLQHPASKDVGSMSNTTRTIVGDVGYIDGRMSPFEGPFSPKTELFVINDRYPAFMAYNPLSDAIANVKLAFDTMKYTFKVVENQSLVKDMLVGQRAVRKVTMGPVDPSPMTIPLWLQKQMPKGMLEFTKQLMEAANV